MTTTYATYYIVRFSGTLTQGPHAGKTYTLATSWGGVQFPTEQAGRDALVTYALREPRLALKLLSRQFVGNRHVETEVLI